MRTLFSLISSRPGFYAIGTLLVSFGVTLIVGWVSMFIGCGVGLLAVALSEKVRRNLFPQSQVIIKNDKVI